MPISTGIDLYEFLGDLVELIAFMHQTHTASAEMLGGHWGDFPHPPHLYVLAVCLIAQRLCIRKFMLSQPASRLV